MRCLTLADALKAQDAVCHFICRDHAGHLMALIQSKGHTVHPLPLQPTQPTVPSIPNDQPLAHAAWLGTTQAHDAAPCATILKALQPDWLVVDHYALDAQWESALRPHCRRIMVIDDLADRPHQCELLLDQTHGRSGNDYRALVPADCTVLCGAQYALLRPEFAQLRTESLRRRQQPQLRRLLVTMGGVDKDNATGKVLQALSGCDLPEGCQITVVMGTTSPWLEQVTDQAARMPKSTTVLTGVTNMARLMTDSDLALGAAGATSWERCCLGLPTLMFVLAANQLHAAKLLADTNAVRLLSLDVNMKTQVKHLVNDLAQDANGLVLMSNQAQNISDGQGCKSVVLKLLS